LPVATPALDPKSGINLKRQQADQTAAADELAKKKNLSNTWTGCFGGRRRQEGKKSEKGEGVWEGRRRETTFSVWDW
jgi:hypothetical protein